MSEEKERTVCEGDQEEAGQGSVVNSSKVFTGNPCYSLL